MRHSRAQFVLVAAILSAIATAEQAKATLIYGFDDASLNGFTGSGATVSYSTTTGVTEGAGAMEISNSGAQGFGGAETTTVPNSFYSAASFNVSVTITTKPTVYDDIVPTFLSTDGTISCDTSNSANFVSLFGVAPGTYTYTIPLNGFYDPDGVLSNDATPLQILAADRATDPADALTGFELQVEHGGSTATNSYVDNITVPTVAVPEPASLSIVAVGGLALLRRRRRSA